MPTSTAPESQLGPEAAWDGERFLTIWSSIQDFSPWGLVTVRGRYSSPDSAPTDNIVLHRTNAQHIPSVAFNGTNYFVVWQDNRYGSWRIYGTGVTPTGEISHPYGGIELSNGWYGGHTPVVASLGGGGNFLVTWLAHWRGFSWRTVDSGYNIGPEQWRCPSGNCA